MEKEKRCTRCKKYSSISNYQKFDRMSDGLHPYCMDCKRAIRRATYARDRERLLKEQKESRKRRPETKAMALRATLKSQAKFPEKHKARAAVKRAIVRGELVRQSCIDCGELRVQAHHPDYSQPLKVIWLCTKHHATRHRKYKTLVRLFKTDRIPQRT